MDSITREPADTWKDYADSAPPRSHIVASATKVVKVKISDIRIDGGTQPRAKLDQSVIDDYADCIDQLPPGSGVYDGISYWLTDGFHRYFARKKRGLDDMDLIVTEGTQRDAVLHSLSANADNGLRRSNDDKRKAVRVMLADKEWSAWSSREIAKHCRVSHQFVEGIRRTIGGEAHLVTLPDDSAPAAPTIPNDVKEKAEAIESSGGTSRIAERNGKAYVQDTTNVGGALPLDARRKALAGVGKVLDKEQVELLAQNTKGLTQKQIKEVATQLKSGTPPKEVLEKFQVDPEEPWKQFNGQVKDIANRLRSLGRELSDVFEADTATKQIRSKWGHWFSYIGTITHFNQFARELEAGLPFRKCDGKPGYLNKRNADIKDNVMPKTTAA